MNIDDILKQKQFKPLDKYLTKEMYKTAGQDLVSRIRDVLETTEKGARDWFYSEIIALGGKRPYDFCKEGNYQEIENLLGRMEYGVYS